MRTTPATLDGGCRPHSGLRTAGRLGRLGRASPVTSAGRTPDAACSPEQAMPATPGRRGARPRHRYPARPEKTWNRWPARPATRGDGANRPTPFSRRTSASASRRSHRHRRPPAVPVPRWAPPLARSLALQRVQPWVRRRVQPWVRARRVVLRARRTMPVSRPPSAPPLPLPRRRRNDGPAPNPSGAARGLPSPASEAPTRSGGATPNPAERIRSLDTPPAVIPQARVPDGILGPPAPATGADVSPDPSPIGVMIAQKSGFAVDSKDKRGRVGSVTDPGQPLRATVAASIRLDGQNVSGGTVSLHRHAPAGGTTGRVNRHAVQADRCRWTGIRHPPRAPAR